MLQITKILSSAQILCFWLQHNLFNASSAYSFEYMVKYSSPLHCLYILNNSIPWLEHKLWNYVWLSSHAHWTSCLTKPVFLLETHQLSSHATAFIASRVYAHLLSQCRMTLFRLQLSNIFTQNLPLISHYPQIKEKALKTFRTTPSDLHDFAESLHHIFLLRQDPVANLALNWQFFCLSHPCPVIPNVYHPAQHTSHISQLIAHNSFNISHCSQSLSLGMQ